MKKNLFLLIAIIIIGLICLEFFAKIQIKKLLERNGGLAVTLSTKINIAHQDKYYTDSEAMNESLDTRGHA